MLFSCSSLVAPSRAISTAEQSWQFKMSQLSELVLLQLNAESWLVEKHLLRSCNVK